MVKAVLFGASCALAAAFSSPLCAQSVQGVAVELANLREDVRGLVQRVGDLQLRVEQLERENNELRAKAEGNFATVAQVNDAVDTMNQTIKSAVATSRTDVLHQVGAQMEKLAKQTNAAIDSLARGLATRGAVAAPTFSDDYPKDGISYTVQKGDTIAEIAKKTGASVKDIINANRIADPTRIQVGQTLFVPAGK